jgi:alkanesulfonate monooxygenase SsuD/methylene tetrahydromethanopterin reductase-like flavin-dependent oxidoreductase (luciferase family)
MEIGIGLPSTVPGVTGEQLTEWARRADQTPLSTLGTIDRIVYPNYEPLTALAAAAAVTKRIRLATCVLLAPLRGNSVLLAKQAATVQHLSGGRLTLGAAPGGRADDFEVSGIELRGRGRVFEGQLETMKRVWAGEEKGYAGPVGPNLDEPPQLIVGGSVDAAFRRAAQYGDGWMMGGGAPDQFREAVTKLDTAWRDAGRSGEPRKMALGYFSLGENAEEDARGYLGDYYAWLGDDIAGMIVGGAAKDADTVRQYISAFEQAGADEFVLFPSSSDPHQVDLLVEAAGI